MNRTSQKEVYEEAFSVLDYWRVLVRRKVLILAVVVTTGLASAGVSFYMTPMYASTTSLFPPVQEAQSVGAGLMSSIPMELGPMTAGFLGLQSPDDLSMSILDSRTVKDNIVKRFDLRRRYGKKTFEAASAALEGNVSIRQSKEKIVYITVEDMDPKVAAQMAEAFVEELDRINKSLVMISGKRTRSFLEERLKGVSKELENAEEALKVFQVKNRAIQLDEQFKGTLAGIGMVKGVVMAKEAELETILSYATLSNPMVELLKAEISGLKNRIKEMEEGSRGRLDGEDKDNNRASFVPTDAIPGLALRYIRLFRNAKIYETLYGLLTQQYEMARIQEAKNTSTVQVLDSANIAVTRSRPNRRKIVFLSTLSALVLSVFFVFLLEHVKRLRN